MEKHALGDGSVLVHHVRSCLHVRHYALHWLEEHAKVQERARIAAIDAAPEGYDPMEHDCITCTVFIFEGTGKLVGQQLVSLVGVSNLCRLSQYSSRRTCSHVLAPGRAFFVCRCLE